MNHQMVLFHLEEYADAKLSASQTQHVERHLKTCDRCLNHLHTIRWTQVLIRGTKLRNYPEPSDSFAQRVHEHLEINRGIYLFWMPIRSITLKALPVMALLAILFSFLAYRQIKSELSAPTGWDDPFLGSYSEQTDNLMGTIFSGTIVQDPNQAILALMGGASTGDKKQHHDELF